MIIFKNFEEEGDQLPEDAHLKDSLKARAGFIAELKANISNSILNEKFPELNVHVDKFFEITREPQNEFTAAFESEGSFTEIILDSLRNEHPIEFIDKIIFILVRWVRYQDYDNDLLYTPDFINYLISLLQNDKIDIIIRGRVLCLIENLSILRSSILEYLIQTNNINIIEKYYYSMNDTYNHTDPIPYIITMLIRLQYNDIDFYVRYLNLIPNFKNHYNEPLLYFYLRFLKDVPGSLPPFFQMMINSEIYLTDYPMTAEFFEIINYLFDNADADDVYNLLLGFDEDIVIEKFDNIDINSEHQKKIIEIIKFLGNYITKFDLSDDVAPKIGKIVDRITKTIGDSNLAVRKVYSETIDMIFSSPDITKIEYIVSNELLTSMFEFFFSDSQILIEMAFKTFTKIMTLTMIHFNVITSIPMRNIDNFLMSNDLEDVFDTVQELIEEKTKNEDKDVEELEAIMRIFQDTLNEFTSRIDELIENREPPQIQLSINEEEDFNDLII